MKYRYVIHPLLNGRCVIAGNHAFHEGDPTESWPYSCYLWLILGGERPVLVDTGLDNVEEMNRGAAHVLRQPITQEPGQTTREQLARFGLKGEDIGAVIITHLHFDHAGGLLAPWQEGQPPRLLFPNARFLVGAAHWARARQPHPRDRASFIPELAGLLEASGRLEVVDGPHSEALGEAVRFHVSDGHTPGLLLAEIGGEGGVVFCADLIPGRPWVHLPVTMGYDRAPELLIDEKRRFLEDMLARVQGRVDHVRLDRVPPLAAPLLLERGRVPVEGRGRERLAEAAAARLLEEAGLADLT